MINGSVWNFEKIILISEKEKSNLQILESFYVKIKKKFSEKKDGR